MKYISFLMLLFLNVEIIAQINRNYETNPDRKRAFNWLFGKKIWLNYNINPPEVKDSSNLNAVESSCSYSDTNGQLLFYSDGITIWNRNHKVIKNGTGINGNTSSCQGAVFVKHPLYDTLVYIFTTDAQGGSKGLQVSKISINPNIDSSKVIEKNQLLISKVCESISVTNHSDRNSVWVVVHGAINNNYYAFLVNSSGIIPCPTVSVGSIVYSGDPIYVQSNSCFSNSGKKYAITDLENFQVELVDFDNEKGIFSNPFIISGITIPTGVEFSRNEKYLYYVGRSNYIKQFNIKNKSSTTIENINNKYLVLNIFLTPRGSILVNIFDSAFMGEILMPDSNGTSANYIKHSLFLKNGKKCTNGLPNFNKSYFYTPSIDFAYKYNCIENSVSFEGRDTLNADSFMWKAKKIYGSLLFSSNLKSPTVNFTDTGVYQVMFIVTNGTRNDTVIKRITIYPKIPKNFLGRDTIYKSNIPFNLVLKTPSNMQCIRWHDSSSLSSYTANTTGIYFVSVTNKAFCTVSDTIRISRCINSLNKPSIYRNFDTLFTNTSLADSFAWFRNEKKIAITKDTFIILTDTGAYRIEASKKGYCNSTSDVLRYNCLVGLANPIIYFIKDTLRANQPMADSFQWYRNSQILSTTKDSFIIITDTGLFMVKALRNKYCNSTSNQIFVKCIDNLIQPYIYLTKDTLYSSLSVADSFVWYRNGEKIKVTSQPFIKLTDTGTYHLEIKKNKLCIKSSTSLVVSKIDVGLFQFTKEKVKIFPNPADQTVNIEVNGYAKFNIRIYDSEGRLVFECLDNVTKTTLDFESFTQGLYLIELINYHTLFHYKILIQ